MPDAEEVAAAAAVAETEEPVEALMAVAVTGVDGDEALVSDVEESEVVLTDEDMVLSDEEIVALGFG